MQPTQTAKLSEFITPKDRNKIMPKQQRKFSFTQPVYLKKLVEAVKSVKEAGKLIGMTASGITNALASKDGVRICVELAAKQVYLGKFAPPPVYGKENADCYCSA